MATDDALAQWDEGTVLMQMGGGELLLRFARSKLVRCDLGRATPLVDDGGRLVALPLAPEQLDDAPPGSVVHLEHGRLVVEQPVATLDPVRLLDLSDWQLESPIVATEARPAPQTARPSAAPEPRLALEPIEFDSRTRPGRARSPHSARRTRAATASAPLDLVRRPSRYARSTLTNPCVHTEDL